MLRGLFILAFCTCFLAAHSQGSALFASSREKNLTPAELSSQLTAGKSSELEKVTAIFTWIAENIDYRVPFASRRGPKKEAEEDTSTILKPLTERVAEIVLRNRLAVCDGYARLFKTLCQYAGIRAEIVTGFVRNQGRGGLRFQSNHSWNAVMIDGKWHLLDATWASGYVNGGRFNRRFDPDYFLPDPRSMLYSHYPENPRWTLLDEHAAPTEFSYQPLKYFASHKFYLKNILPASGKITLRPGGTTEIAFETAEPIKDVMVSSDPYLEQLGILPTKPGKPFHKKGNSVRLTYQAEVHQPQWLYVVLNGEVVMRYQFHYKTP